MSFDITWCSGERCDKTESCYRSTKNLAKLAKEKCVDFNELVVSVASFADHNGMCDMYDSIFKKKGFVCHKCNKLDHKADQHECEDK